MKKEKATLLAHLVLFHASLGLYLYACEPRKINMTHGRSFRNFDRSWKHSFNSPLLWSKETWLMEVAESIYPHFDACNIQSTILAVWTGNYDCHQNLLLVGFQVVGPYCR